MNREDTDALMERLRVKAAERQARVDEVAKILWENGEMLADCEGGAMPCWEELANARVTDLPDSASEADKERHASQVFWWRESQHAAERLLDLDHASALRLAALLIQRAEAATVDMERQLWERIERAEQRKAGSLSRDHHG